jgi:hypothetical protein
MSRSYYSHKTKETICETTKKSIEMELGDLWGYKLLIFPNCDDLGDKNICKDNGKLCPYQSMKTSELKEKFFPEVYTDRFVFE